MTGISTTRSPYPFAFSGLGVKVVLTPPRTLVVPSVGDSVPCLFIASSGCYVTGKPTDGFGLACIRGAPLNGEMKGPAAETMAAIDTGDPGPPWPSCAIGGVGVGVEKWRGIAINPATTLGETGMGRLGSGSPLRNLPQVIGFIPICGRRRSVEGASPPPA